MEWVEWAIWGYLGIGVWLTIIRTANPSMYYRWMAEKGADWWNGFVAQSVLWPVFVIRNEKGEWSGRRPLNWASILGMMVLPKRSIWVNAIHFSHPLGHYRFEAHVPSMDIAEYAENGELYAMQNDLSLYVGCTKARPGNVDWIDAHSHLAAVTPVPSVEWYQFIRKSKFDEYVLDIAKRDKATEQFSREV